MACWTPSTAPSTVARPASTTSASSAATRSADGDLLPLQPVRRLLVHIGLSGHRSGQVADTTPPNGAGDARLRRLPEGLPAVVAGPSRARVAGAHDQPPVRGERDAVDRAWLHAVLRLPGLLP